MSDIDIDLLQAAMDNIHKHPEQHHQGHWRCNSGQCLAGWVALTAGVEWANESRYTELYEFVELPEDFDLSAYTKIGEDDWETPDGWVSSLRRDEQGKLVMHVAEYARMALGLSQKEADRLFSGGNRTSLSENSSLSTLRQRCWYGGKT